MSQRLLLRSCFGWLVSLAAIGCSSEPSGNGPGTGPLAPAGSFASPLAGGSAITGTGGVGGAFVPVGGGGQGPGQINGGAGGTGVVGPMAGSGGSAVVNVPPPGMRGSWPSFGGDLAHTRSSAKETMISASNVMGLKPAFDIKAPGVTATPVLFDGVVYWGDWGGIVHATNIQDQKELWKLDRSAMKGGYTGSAAVTETTVYVANRNGLLSSIDRNTGVPNWEITLDAGVHTHVWSSPVVAEQDNVLVIGIGGYGTRDNNVALPRSQLETFHGRVEGIDTRDGKSLWKFETAPMPNGAGVAVWSSAAIDVERKLAFIGTGNNYYTPVSPYSDSLVAINYMTGVRAWHKQFTANDAWTVGTVLGGGVDGDVGAAPNLFTIGERAVVGVGEKQGSYHVHDRMTGDEVWKRKLTAGGYQGGVIAPAAFANGLIYVISNNDTRNSTLFALKATDGVPLWDEDLTDPTFGAPAVANGIVYVGDQAGNMWARDAMSGASLWTARLPQGRGGGFSLVDGVLFTGYGFHFSESRREPLMGGLIAYSLTGTIMPPMPSMMADCMEGAQLTSAATFTNVYQGVLCPLGCTKVCHSTSAEAGLRLEGKMFAYDGLFNVPAKGEPCKDRGHVLVVPNNPAASVLLGKLSGMPQCGVSMPPGSATSPVTAPQLDALRAWISAGAPNN
jgi:polyvinyl alcohol dehydrogenase (cytochrome)